MMITKVSKRLCGGLAALLVSLAAAGAAYGAEVGVNATTIKLGMFGPLTGPVSIYGYPINNGAIAVYKQANDQGGIHGRKIEVVHEDGACDPSKTRAAVKKLIHRDDVFMVHGGTCSAAVLASRDEFIESEVTYMLMAATMDAITEPVSKYVFTAIPPGSIEGLVMLNFAKSIPSAKKLALIRHGNEWADAKLKAVMEGYKAAGFEMVADVQLEAKASDATTQVLKIKAASPDVTMFVLYPGESAVFLRDAAKYGLKGPFVGSTAAQDLLDLADRAGSRNAVEDVYVTSYLKGSIGSPELEQWTALYKKYFPNDAIQAVSFAGMASAITVVEALRQAGKELTREGFIAALENIKNGDAGPGFCQVNLSAKRHRGCLEGTIWTLRDDKIVNVGPTWPASK